jgi:ubiquitin-like 1-activating enzyme E1 A
LITPINGPNTELAKNLILAGVNVTIYDDAIVDEDDFESNFLISEKDIGRKRSQAVF